MCVRQPIIWILRRKFNSTTATTAVSCVNEPKHLSPATTLVKTGRTRGQRGRGRQRELDEEIIYIDGGISRDPGEE